mmetsp:Transcript_71124/g.189845  ORF Transcript_71124/g.189845 Transcript_71124/m.189845 type:complete len:812 (-) Transcript_71124:1940-4375(-)
MQSLSSRKEFHRLGDTLGHIPTKSHTVLTWSLGPCHILDFQKLLDKRDRLLDYLNLDLIDMHLLLDNVIHGHNLVNDQLNGHLHFDRYDLSHDFVHVDLGLEHLRFGKLVDDLERNRLLHGHALLERNVDNAFRSRNFLDGLMNELDRNLDRDLNNLLANAIHSQLARDILHNILKDLDHLLLFPNLLHIPNNFLFYWHLNQTLVVHGTIFGLLDDAILKDSLPSDLLNVLGNLDSSALHRDGLDFRPLHNKFSDCDLNNLVHGHFHLYPLSYWLRNQLITRNFFVGNNFLDNLTLNLPWHLNLTELLNSDNLLCGHRNDFVDGNSLLHDLLNRNFTESIAIKGLFRHNLLVVGDLGHRLVNRYLANLLHGNKLLGVVFCLGVHGNLLDDIGIHHFLHRNLAVLVNANMLVDRNLDDLFNINSGSIYGFFLNLLDGSEHDLVSVHSLLNLHLTGPLQLNDFLCRDLLHNIFVHNFVNSLIDFLLHNHLFLHNPLLRNLDKLLHIHILLARDLPDTVIVQNSLRWDLHNFTQRHHDVDDVLHHLLDRNGLLHHLLNGNFDNAIQFDHLGHRNLHQFITIDDTLNRLLDDDISVDHFFHWSLDVLVPRHALFNWYFNKALGVNRHSAVRDLHHLVTINDALHRDLHQLCDGHGLFHNALKVFLYYSVAMHNLVDRNLFVPLSCDLDRHRHFDDLIPSQHLLYRHLNDPDNRNRNIDSLLHRNLDEMILVDNLLHRDLLQNLVVNNFLHRHSHHLVVRNRHFDYFFIIRSNIDPRHDVTEYHFLRRHFNDLVLIKDLLNLDNTRNFNFDGLVND